MFDFPDIVHTPDHAPSFQAPAPVARMPALLELEAMLAALPLHRRRIQARQTLFRAGQPHTSLYLVHAGFFKTCVLSEDGREKITGFHLRGDLLGIDALGMPCHGCDAVSLDLGEVWEIPSSVMTGGMPEIREAITSALAAEIRRDWNWMLMVSTLTAEQRVATFLLDLATRLQSLGFSRRHVMLRMTRGDLGNYLALKLETVVRALTRMQGAGLISIDRREIRIEDEPALRELMSRARTTH
ncbi:helix-turn-helix domain-containing protein [Marilutibacter chinensis]|uniref:CRP-like protein Clp n=1 Tax=Marilutibacter chinensis TaxID=2912247 RepID=A0ABS9HQC9_9GAMM|nr:helix-turn-helix domain-containing protein [Lysobacter chinensis]MCF7220355.1 helix-turn-helix domain-containing protein [Lysobacter chinensis]